MNQVIVKHLKRIKFLTLFVLFILGANLSAEEEKITVLTEEWPPYNYTENTALKGFSVEVVQHIIRDLEANAVIKVYPGMRASHMLKNEPRKMFISMFRTKDRENMYHWIGPLVDSSIYFFKKKGNPLNIATLEDAKKVKIISTRHGGLVFDRLKTAGFTNLDSRALDGKAIYKKLLMGRCDLGISDSSMGVRYILKKLNYPTDALVQTNVKVVSSELYIATSKDIPPQEINRWQESLNKLKVSGTYKKILEKYEG